MRPSELANHAARRTMEKVFRAHDTSMTHTIRGARAFRLPAVFVFPHGAQHGTARHSTAGALALFC